MRAAALLLALGLTACGPGEPERTPEQVAAEQVAAEQAAAREAARDGALGAQVEALDRAATVQDTLDTARAERDAAVEEATDEGAGDGG